MPSDVTGEQPPVLVVAAARAERDDDGDGFAFEVGVRLGLGVMSEADRKACKPHLSNQRKQRCPLRHGSLPRPPVEKSTKVLARVVKRSGRSGR